MALFSNDPQKDPHVDLLFLAFSVEEALKKPRFWQRVIRCQAWYFVPSLLLEGLGIRLASINFALGRGRKITSRTDISLMVLHFVVYLALLAYAFDSFRHSLAFVAIHQGLWGLYYGLVFAPNHKGMEIPPPNNQWDDLQRQVRTTRDVAPSWFAPQWFVDFLYGGLNHQVAHHLFPTMPRNNLGAATEIIWKFCSAREIPYSRKGMLSSYWTILRCLDEVSHLLGRNLAPTRG